MYTITFDVVGDKHKAIISAFTINPLDNIIQYNNEMYYPEIGKDDFDNMAIVWIKQGCIERTEVASVTYSFEKGTFNLCKNKLDKPITLKYRKIKLDL